MAVEFPSASILDNVRFNEAIVVPNALQGLFKRRRPAVAVATRADVDGQAVRLLSGLRDRHDGRPVWVRVVKDPALLVLDADDLRHVLEGAPEPFAADPEAKRKGMSAFQPHALTISRGELWRIRRRWTEQVLETPEATHGLAGRIRDVVREEIGALARDARTVTYLNLHEAFQRLTRRVVLGDAAADDQEVTDELSELMAAANGMPSERPPGYERFAARLAAYVEGGADGSLAGRAAAVQAEPDVRPDGQVAHWLFATQDTLSANVMRALALLAAMPVPPGAQEGERLRAVLLEAMRLWPTTPLLSRETTKPLVWHGVQVPAGTNVLISNTFFHRDPRRLGDAADRFTPEGWTNGRFGGDWGLNFFSHGPQGCPGANLALLIGTEVLATLRSEPEPLSLRKPSLELSGALPHMLDVFGIEVGL